MTQITKQRQTRNPKYSARGGKEEQWSRKTSGRELGNSGRRDPVNKNTGIQGRAYLLD